MQITTVPIDKILPYPHNNRVHEATQVERIAHSIKEFGFNQPLVLDETGTILVGHGRLLAAQQLGLTELPCVYLKKLTEKQKRAYRVLDNKLQNDSTWDFDSLKLELDWLDESGVDLGFWGLDTLINLFPEEELEVEEDEFDGAVPTESYIKRGDLIELGRHRVLCGDCREEKHDIVADLIITDPPYGVSYKGKTKDALEIENDDLSEEALSDLWNDALDQSLSVLKDGGSFYATVPPGPLRQVFAQALKDREILRQELIWLKDSMVMGRSDYHYKHEPILYGWKPGAAHYMTADRTKTSVLEHARPKRSTEHPTMKPLSLWGELIGNSTHTGQIVYDPFLGSGTTLIACDQLNRTCYGIEISPQYCQVILERYQAHCTKVGKEFDCKINGVVFDGAYGTAAA